MSWILIPLCFAEEWAVIGSTVQGSTVERIHSGTTAMDGGSVDYAGAKIDRMYARPVVTERDEGSR